MKTMCPPSYHHIGFVASHALGHMMYGYTMLVPITYNHSYIMTILLLWDLSTLDVVNHFDHFYLYIYCTDTCI